MIGWRAARRAWLGGEAGCSVSNRCITELSAAICWSARRANICRSASPTCSVRALKREEWVHVGEGDWPRERGAERFARSALGLA